MKQKVNINNRSVESAGITNDYKQALTEYIWNGFDAKATKLEIDYTANEVGYVEALSIKDNGTGINLQELDKTFGAFLDSQKKNSYQRSSFVHGKKGKGRYSFMAFAQIATWFTVYKQEDKLLEFDITIAVNDKDYFNYDNLKVSKLLETGTKVVFNNINLTEAQLDSVELYHHLSKTFGWFLFLNRSRNHEITINKNPLNYNYLIVDSGIEKAILEDASTNETFDFEIYYVRWNEKIGDRYYIYLLDEEQVENSKIPTSLNNKDNEFHHSVYVISKYFNDFTYESELTSTIFGYNQTHSVFKQLQKKIKLFLEGKERLFLRLQGSEKLIDRFEKEGIIPKFQSNPYDQLRRTDLVNTIKEIYCVQPKIFKNLAIEQGKTMVGFLNLLLDTDERENIISILENIVKLNPEERQNLTDILKITNLSHVTNLLKMIEERYRTYYALREMVFNKNLKANERDHLQKLIEDAYWIFGEKYHLVTSAEPKFEEALRRFNYHLTGKNEKKKIDHEDKNKEMDIFACRQNVLSNKIENIVIELKHPNIKLGEEELSQVKKYMRVILSENDFNAKNMSWEFYLIGNEFDSTGYIESEITTNKPHGERSLVFKKNNEPEYKIYVKTWSEIFAEFEVRHNYLNKKLYLKRDNLFTQAQNPEEILKDVARSKIAIEN